MRILRRIAHLFQKGKREAEMAAEMQAHLDLQAAAHERAGTPPEEARRAAQRDFGGVAQMKERAREVRGFLWLEQCSQDLRYAVRQLLRARGYTAVVVLTLALGIGATTAIYSVVDAVLLNPVPGPHSDRLVQVGQWMQYANRPERTRAGITLPVKDALETQTDFFAETTWCDSVSFSREQEGFSSTVFGNMVPPNFFRMLGVQPVLGRVFAKEEAVDFTARIPEQDTTVLLSHSWWRSEFGGDPGVLGRSVQLGERRFTIIGVMPEYFQFPHSVQFWLPARDMRLRPGSIGGGNIRFIARLKPDVSRLQVEAILPVLRDRLLQSFPASERSYGTYWRQSPSGLHLWVLSLREAMQTATYTQGYDAVQRTLLGFMGAIGFVLAIVCANVANLTLARTERRQHELAVRAALGAGRGRLMRQLLTESLLLALLGGMAGLGVTLWGIKLLAAFNTLPQLRPIVLDGRVLAIALAASVLTGLLFGLVPAWRAGRARINDVLAQGSLGATTGARGTRYRATLVVIEIALAMVLLAGAGLTIQSVTRLLRVDPGYEPASLVKISFHTAGINYGQIDARNALIHRIHERISGLSGVNGVGVFKDEYTPRKIAVDENGPPVLAHGAHVGWGTADFFRATQARVLAGRLFEASDLAADARTVVVNESMARLCWPGADAVGKRFRALEMRGTPTFEVIGVVRDTRLNGFGETVRPLFLRPYAEADIVGAQTMLVARIAREPVALLPAIRQALQAEGPNVSTPTITLFSQALFDETRPQRTFRNYLAVFASVGLVLAALGIYGVLSYAVARWTREIGIRMAIGADRQHVIQMVLADGGRLVAIGVGAGLIAAFWLTTLLEKQLFATSPRDPLVLGIVAAMLSAITLLACWLPARRAARVDPMVALRSE